VIPPTGSITFLFTDIEGSTRMLEELGDVWADALATHNRLVREGIAAHGGHEVDRQGDAFFVVFEDAASAVAAVRALQAAFAREAWPGGADLRVRMGLHSGDVRLRPEGYVGVDVHRGARICAAAHGGQILLSRETLDQVADLDVRDLGEHRLKDLTKPVRLYQLLGEGLDAVFPPPRSLNTTNLPMQRTALIDREQEVAATVALLRDDSARLVTLTGPGGTGKTRVALQTAAELVGTYTDGVFFVPLAPVVNLAHLESTIATTIGAPLEGNGLVRFVRDRELLLTLDNFEHLLESAELVANLLTESAKLRVLVTSRAPLHLSGEHEVPIQPLSEEHALALLTERARSARPDFEPDEAAGQLCQRLEGMPLAIELAAARLKHLTAEALLVRLDRSLDLLSGGARDLPERQRTLRATIEWSYRLLDSSEQLLFERLSVFAGGWTLDQAEVVCSLPGEDGVDVLDGIASLVDKSLVYWTPAQDRDPRYFMHTTIAEYALERLRARGEEAVFRGGHRDHFRKLVEGVRPIATLAGIHALRPERENLRAALRWSLDAGDTEDALRIAYRLWRYWTESGSLREGRQWLEAALANLDMSGTVLEARALDASAFLAAQQGDFEIAEKRLDAAEDIARASRHSWLALGWCLYRRGQLELDRGRLEPAERPLLEAAELFRTQAYGIGVAWALIELGRRRLLGGEATLALRLFRGAIEADRADPEQIAVAYAQSLAGSTATLLGDAGGLEEMKGGLETLDALQANYTLAVALLHAAPAYRQAGDARGERQAVARATRLCLDSGVVPRASACLEGAARIAVDEERLAEAARLWGAADQAAAAIGVVPSPLRLSLREPLERTVREALGEDTFRREFEYGRSYTLENALQLGIGMLAQPELLGAQTAPTS
jgi:predicted ATPase/class 3 adenylate cyclase